MGFRVLLGNDRGVPNASAVAAASSRSVWILVASLLMALVIGVGVASWLVRSIAMPVARLTAILGADLPS